MQIQSPDQEFNLKLWVMDQYVESCFAITQIERPSSWSKAWGMVTHMLVRGEVASMKDWARENGIEIIGITPERLRDTEESLEGLMSAASDATHIDLRKSEDTEDPEGIEDGQG